MSFAHKIWANPELLSEYDKAVAQAKEMKPDMDIPSHLDMRGADHVFGLLSVAPEEAEVELLPPPADTPLLEEDGAE